MTGTGIAVSAGLGIGGLIQGGKEADKAEEQFKAAMATGQKQLDFNEEQLAEWETTFGGLEDNLTSYYNNLDPTKFATQGKENLNMQMDKQLNQLNESLSAQGMQTSGMKAQAEKEAAFGKAMGNAKIDTMSEDYVAQQQAGWLNANRGQQQQAQQGINSAYGNMQGLQSQQAQQHGESQAGYLGAAGNMFGTAMGLGINGDFGSSTPSGSNNLMPGSNRGPQGDWSNTSGTRIGDY